MLGAKSLAMKTSLMTLLVYASKCTQSNAVVKHHMASKRNGLEIGTSKAETLLTVFVDFILLWTVTFLILEKNRLSKCLKVKS